MACIVCWEDIPPDAQVFLQPCQHTACRGCVQNWIETCEQQGQDDAKCPHCRQVMSHATCQAVLGGRPYQAKRLTADDVPQELDEFTLTWLQENGARQCKNCGAWLTDEEEGQEPLMCLCGYCYCWTCDMSALDCDCGHDEFYDNVTGEGITIRNRGASSSEDDPIIVLATEEDREDFRAFLEARRDAHRGGDSDDDDDDDESNHPEAETIEESAEANFISIFEQEVEAEANFESILDWPSPEAKVEEARPARKPCASDINSRGATEQNTIPDIVPLGINRRVQSVYRGNVSNNERNNELSWLGDIRRILPNDCP
uniref:RING-type domain-containing protein n=1 Tax=Amphora coffeiformis TaxID=265554 RepID=A0A7S3L0S8_9STRA